MRVYNSIENDQPIEWATHLIYNLYTYYIASAVDDVIFKLKITWYYIIYTDDRRKYSNTCYVYKYNCRVSAGRPFSTAACLEDENYVMNTDIM